MGKIEDSIIARPLTDSDTLIARQVEAYTTQEAAHQTMVARQFEQLLPIYARRNAFSVIKVTEAGEQIVAHAMIHDATPQVEKFGPFGLLRRHLFEVSSVFATERGNGFAAKAVVGLIKERQRPIRRIRERRFVPERYIALVRIDNTSSNKLFRKLRGVRELSEEQTQKLPQVFINEPVGTGEHAQNFIGYDVTRARR